MPHVITQQCCGDASCVYACPVNCIHPGPDEPGYGAAEMLFIDPAACVDCGACVTACPVGAIVADSRLTPAQRPFAAVNAAFYPNRPAGVRVPPPEALAPVPPAPRIRRSARPLTVAIVGSGPAGMYAADELLTQPGVVVNMFDRLPAPYGLLRAGVAPDHPATKAVAGLFDRISRRPGFRFHLNVEVGDVVAGKHLSHADLLAHHHAVLYAVGAPGTRRLEIDGVDLPGNGTAVETMAWINGDAGCAGRSPDLGHERVVIVGNGNVALDVARLLAVDPETLAGTDISDTALTALRGSKVRDVLVAARRGPADSAFTLPELIGLVGPAGPAARVVLGDDDRALVRRDLAVATNPLTRTKLEILAGLPRRSAAPVVIRLAYGLTPRRIIGSDRVRAVEFERSAGPLRVEAGLVLSSLGQRGVPVPGLPFDRSTAVVPNLGGRVVDPDTGRPIPAAYVAGWIKRGPSGFIGTNKACAMQTVAALVDDFNAGLLSGPVAGPAALDRLVRTRQPDVVDGSGWRAIDAAETARGTSAGRSRVKFTSVADMLAAAGVR